MEGEEVERLLGMMQERSQELRELGVAFDRTDNKPNQQWLAECATVIGMSLSQLNIQQQAAALVGFAAAMWQAGYEAAPKLEFVLPEGAGG